MFTLTVRFQVKILQENDGASDIDVDVENDEDDNITMKNTEKPVSVSSTTGDSGIGSLTAGGQEPKIGRRRNGSKSESLSEYSDRSQLAVGDINLADLSEEALNQPLTDEVPANEVVLEEDHATELEKVFHRDYFEGGVTKTVERYFQVSVKMNTISVVMQR